MKVGGSQIDPRTPGKIILKKPSLISVKDRDLQPAF